jgi:hypothetical protein
LWRRHCFTVECDVATHPHRCHGRVRSHDSVANQCHKEAKRSDATNCNGHKKSQYSHLLSLHLTSKHCTSLGARPAFQEAAHGKQQLTSALRHRQRRRRRCLCGPGAITHRAAAVSACALSQAVWPANRRAVKNELHCAGNFATWPTVHLLPQQLARCEQGCTTPTRQACCRVRVSHSECVSCVPLKTKTLYLLRALLEITPEAQLWQSVSDSHAHNCKPQFF